MEVLTPRTKLVVLDDVTSNTALPLPVEAICAACRAHGALTLVDAAHSAASRSHPHLPFLAHADFAAGNLHKWACAPRGAGFLWARREHQHILEPPLISHGYGGGFASSFIWSGANDYSPLLALPSLLRGWWGAAPAAFAAAPTGATTATAAHTAADPAAFPVHLPLARSVAYQRRLLRDATTVLADAWGTQPLLPPSACYHMALVELPSGLRDADGGRLTTSKAVQDALHYAHAVECPVKTVGGRLYVRASAAVYNEIADYQRLANAVLTMRG